VVARASAAPMSVAEASDFSDFRVRKADMNPPRPIAVPRYFPYLGCNPRAAPRTAGKVMDGAAGVDSRPARARIEPR